MNLLSKRLKEAMKKVSCPNCRKMVDWLTTPTRPFCSEKCKNYDLGKWANEEYRVPVEEPDGGTEVNSEGSHKKQKKD